ncbi:MSEP-CTERM sorting domain-containing protein [Aureivirga sp. CE67]|uniref:MSEP-CTERM sorting domain-containing protein n=1 Tax=Aureivirga sp. CE67 TaxID=1788983 RepID=UPI0018CB13C3|nr:MSEP-CTERM sorting domain-containing protein [Aureivirga sp. CE67]
MKNFLNPKWMLIISTLPVLILAIICYNQFELITPYLDEKAKENWNYLFIFLGSVSIIALVHSIFLITKKKLISLKFTIIHFITFAAFFIFFIKNMSSYSSWRVPRWLTNTDNIFQYVGTFIIPTLIYLMICGIKILTPEHKKHNALVNMGIAVAIPISWYIVVNVISSFWKFRSNEIIENIGILLFVISVIAFFFFLFRFFYIVTRKRANSKKSNKYQQHINFCIGFILPLLGLLIYAYSFEGNLQFIGKFDNFWIYFFTIVNGIVLTIRSTSNPKINILLFFIKSICFTFSLYFFVIFLPLIPFSLIAIIFLGVGILMLAPIFLFIIQVKELRTDFDNLSKQFSSNKLITLMIVGFLIIPIGITIKSIKDRNTIMNTLDYIYNPNYFVTKDINTESLEKVIKSIRHNKQKRDQLFENELPFISNYYNWIVLDNLTLSEDKLNEIESIFFGKEYKKPIVDFVKEKDVIIKDLKHKSVFDSKNKVWISTIDLEVLNNLDRGFREYSTILNLPEGAWINDYYLYVGDKKEKGILAEKKAAKWIYSSIKNVNRDPGILFYTTGNTISFRVFPFANKELRKTGFEIIHKEPFLFKIDDRKVQLGEKNNSSAFYENDDFVFLTSKEKDNLLKIKRKGYFHFLIDTSKNLDRFTLENRMEELQKKHPEFFKNAKITFVNRVQKTVSYDENWKIEYEIFKKEGGFYLDRAIRENLVKSYMNNEKTFPIFITITDEFDEAILNKDFADLKFTFPENPFFYNLIENGNLETHSLIKKPRNTIDSHEFNKNFESVLEYEINLTKSRFLANNSGSELVLKNELFNIPEDLIQENSAITGLYMDAKNRSFLLYPNTLENDWKKQVKYSFQSRIMNRFTSYIVVENESQKKALLKKQEEILSGKNTLDAGEEAQRMSEPSMYIVLILFLIIIYRKKIKHFLRKVSIQNQ